jgi:hypothetical protein
LAIILAFLQALHELDQMGVEEGVKLEAVAAPGFDHPIEAQDLQLLGKDGLRGLESLLQLSDVQGPRDEGLHDLEAKRMSDGLEHLGDTLAILRFDQIPVLPISRYDYIAISLYGSQDWFAAHPF